RPLAHLPCRCSATVPLSVVEPARLLPRVLTRALKAANSPLRILFLEGRPAARAKAALPDHVGVSRQAGPGPVRRRYGARPVFLRVRHDSLLSASRVLSLSAAAWDRPGCSSGSAATCIGGHPSPASAVPLNKIM